MKKAIAITGILLIIVSAVLIFWNEVVFFYNKITFKLPAFEEKIGEIISKEFEEKVYIPSPLRTSKESQTSLLTKDGVIEFTNQQREKYGLAPLAESAKLDSSAGMKTDDMFESQYFEHVSPVGIGVQELAGSVGYKYITLGENLALGNFESDEALVQAWMDSPGHRANILNADFREIGVSVMKGIFEDKATWLAVQHFGLPLSACPEPDPGIKAEITINEVKIQGIQHELDDLKIEIENLEPRRRDLYMQKIKEYNDLVSAYNNLVSRTDSLVKQYNSQVQLFNSCANK